MTHLDANRVEALRLLTTAISLPLFLAIPDPVSLGPVQGLVRADQASGRTPSRDSPAFAVVSSGNLRVGMLCLIDDFVGLGGCAVCDAGLSELLSFGGGIHSGIHASRFNSRVSLHKRLETVLFLVFARSIEHVGRSWRGVSPLERLCRQLRAASIPP